MDTDIAVVQSGEGAHTPPATEDLDEITAERADLYRCMPPEVLKVPLLVRKADINDRIPTEA